MYTHGGGGGGGDVAAKIGSVRPGTLQHARMAYPPSYHPIKNLTQFRSGNWTWAPPGDRGNVCDFCGTHCFCDAEEGLLPRTRGAAAGLAAPVAALAANAAAPAADAAAPAVVEDVEFEGIVALRAYDDE